MFSLIIAWVEATIDTNIIKGGMRMDRYGQVVELREGQKALVKVRKHLTCGHCNRCGGFFGDPEKSVDDYVEVLNPINAEKDEHVRMETDPKEMLLAAFLLYIVPLIGLLAGLFLGRNFAVSAGLSGNPDLWGFFIGTLAMVSIFYFFRRQEARLAEGRRFKAIITAVIDERDIPEEAKPSWSDEAECSKE